MAKKRIVILLKNGKEVTFNADKVTVDVNVSTNKINQLNIDGMSVQNSLLYVDINEIVCIYYKSTP